MTGSSDELADLVLALQEQVDDAEILRLDNQFVDLARNVLRLWREWWVSGAGARVLPERDRKFRVIYPLSCHALNHAELSIGVLKTQPWAAAGNARIAFEHALAAQWVLLTADGEQQLLNYLDKEAHKRAKSFHEALGEPEGYLAMVGEQPATTSWSVWNACSRFADSPKLFYDIYRNLGGAAHPSLGMVVAYLDASPGRSVRLSPRGTARGCDETPRAVALSSLWALDALEEIREGRPHVDELNTIGQSHSVPACLRDSDQHPERQNTEK